MAAFTNNCLLEVFRKLSVELIAMLLKATFGVTDYGGGRYSHFVEDLHVCLCEQDMQSDKLV